MPHPPDILNDPWAYTISDFPENYKLFAVERQVQGNSPPRKDYYLCGVPLPSSMYNLTDNSFQVGNINIDHHENFIPTYIGYLMMLGGLEDHASVNTVALASHKKRSIKFSPCLQAKKVPSSPEDPGASKQGN